MTIRIGQIPHPKPSDGKISPLPTVATCGLRAVNRECVQSPLRELLDKFASNQLHLLHVHNNYDDDNDYASSGAVRRVQIVFSQRPRSSKRLRDA